MTPTSPKNDPEFQRKLEALRRRDPKSLSILEQFILLPDDVKAERLATLSDEEVNRLNYDIRYTGRPDQQLPAVLFDPSDTAPYIWLNQSGRGSGKTQMGGGNLNLLAEENPGIRMGIIGTTAAEVRDALLWGESGLITTANPDFKPTHHPSQNLVTWPNGSMALTFSAQEPEDLRSQQFHVVWLDELAKWRYQNQIWDQLPYVVRLTFKPGFKTWVKPLIIIGTTPRPTKLIKALRTDPDVLTTTVNSFINEANLNSKTIKKLTELKGTRLGRQEINAEVLDDNPNGIDGFNYENFDNNRVYEDDIPKAMQNMARILISIDPATTSNENSDKTGLLVLGKDTDGHGHVIHNGSLKATPNEWALKAIALYEQFKANLIVAEVNQGGDLVKAVLDSQQANLPFKKIHASRGKASRAEPIGVLYARNLIHHHGEQDDLEREMVEFDPSIPKSQQKSPDQMDALVHGFTELFLEELAPAAVPRIYSLNS